MGGGAWPFLVGGAICLVNSDNERDSGMLTSYATPERSASPNFLEGLRGTAGGIRIAPLEVKFLDRRKTDQSESICQECFH